jgi:hypothetical protein
VPPRLTRSRLNKAFRAYLESGTLATAAGSIRVHPKTLQRAARRENWAARAAAIHAAAAAQANGLLATRQAQARAHARSGWTNILDAAQTTEGVLATLRKILRHD